MRDFSQLPGDLMAAANRLEAGASRIQRDVTRVIHERVVYSTPVDTGRARSNWLVSADEPINYSIFPYAPGAYLGIDETANAEAAIEQGIAATASLTTKNERVWIVNNVLYIADLNEGTSPQADAGFVELAIHDGKRFAKGLNVFGSWQPGQTTEQK